jgi:hypothetical protein
LVDQHVVNVPAPQVGQDGVEHVLLLRQLVRLG